MVPKAFGIAVVIACACVASAWAGAVGQTEEDTHHWAYLPETGVSGRPFVSDLSVTTNGVTFVAWSGLTDTTQAVADSTHGKLTAAVYATNMCTDGAEPSGMCYAVPNRVGIMIGVTDGAPYENDLSLGTCTDHNITADSVFDVTIQLNTFADSASWTWMNGELLYWSFGEDSIRLRFRPALAPMIDWSSYPDNRCTATPIGDCDVTQTTGSMLAANFFFAADQTLTYLAGAAFATSNAIMGYLNPNFVNGQYNPLLEYQLSGAHFQSDGSTLQIGHLHAIIPNDIVFALFPGYDGQDPASYFNVTREGDTGSVSEVISFSVTTEEDEGTDGLAFDVTGVTFSSPTYVLSTGAASAVVPSVLLTLFALVACWLSQQ